MHSLLQCVRNSPLRRNVLSPAINSAEASGNSFPRFISNRSSIVSAPSDRTSERQVVSTEQARQGVTGHNVRYVLGSGLVAIVIVFAIVYLVYFGGGGPA
jgi:hypothetical protein